MDNYITLFRRLAALDEGEAVPMHMPGHKRNPGDIEYLQGIGAKYDISEICGFDDLSEPRGILKDAMERAAEVFGSEKSFFLINGSTGGVLSAVRAASVVSDSGKLIMARNSHRSVYNAAELCALEPIYLSAPTVAGFGFCGSMPPKAVEIAVRDNPGTPVIITSPTYEGVISNIAEISIICHMYGCPLIVDEAHGAHLDLSAHFVGGAVSGGADIVVQSIHKTLPGLTQSAILHLNGDLITQKDVIGELSVFQSSSPSYLLMASIDGAVDLVKNRGGELFSAWKRRLERFDRKVSALQNLKVPGHSELFECQTAQKTPGYVRLGLANSEVYRYDRSKILICCEGTDTTGVELMQKLRERFKIECEMAAGGYCLAMTGLLDTNESIDRLAAAICTLDGETRRTAPRLPFVFPGMPPRRMSVGAALREPFRDMSLRDVRGRIAAEYIWSYPPGIPLVVPGEELTQELIGSLFIQRETGIALRSSSGGMPRTVRVVN